MKPGISRRAGEPADLSGLGDVAPEFAANLASVAGDVALVLDRKGVIRNIALGGLEPVTESPESWIGRAWTDIVTVESREKVEQLLREVARGGTAQPRQVNHPADAGGPDVPITYTAVRLGANGAVLAIGRDLRAISSIQRRLVEAQQSVERDYWRMRQAETRYRLLFQVASDAVIVVDAGSLRIVDANAAAGRLLSSVPDKLVGKSATAVFDRAVQGDVGSLLAKSRVTGRATEGRIRVGEAVGTVALAITPFRAEGATLLLVRARVNEVPGVAERSLDDALLDLFERMPEALVLTDEDGVVLRANAAFLDLAQLTNEERAKGLALESWLGRPGSDLPTMLTLVKKQEVLHRIATAVRPEFGQSIEVEVSVSRVQNGEGNVLGFTMRRIEPRQNGARGNRDLGAAVEQLTEMVGTVSLPDLLRDTTDLVERHYIRAALELTDGNRTSAAELLGLSRQSLYVKLRRYGFVAGDGDAPEEAD